MKLAKVIERGKNIYELLNASFQVLKDYGNDESGIKSNKKYCFPRGEIMNCKVLMEEMFMIKQWNDIIKQYDEVRKVSVGYGDDYAIGWLLDYAYFKDNYRLIAVDLSK